MVVGMSISSSYFRCIYYVAELEACGLKIHGAVWSRDAIRVE